MTPPPVDPKRTNLKASVLAADVYEYGPPGSVRENAAGWLKNACPGCGRIAVIRVGNPKPTDEKSTWLITGDWRHPKTLTLHPSVHCVGCCGWHGFLEKGVWRSV